MVSMYHFFFILSHPVEFVILCLIDAEMRLDTLYSIIVILIGN